MSIAWVNRLWRWGIGAACTGIMGLVIALVAACPEMLMAQVGAEAILPAAIAAADKLPHDVVKLCLIGIIVMALALVSVVAMLLRAMAAQQKDFSGTVREFADKPCLMETEQGLAVMGSALGKAARAERAAETERLRRARDGKPE